MLVDESELTPYEIEQERLKDAAKLIFPIEEKLRRLPKHHIEELVIWLKNIHNPSDGEDRDRDNWVPFYNKVNALKVLPEQIDFQNRTILALRRALYLAMGIGALVVLAFWGLYEGLWLSLILLVGIPFLWKRCHLWMQKAVIISKDQEQKNLFTAIREARNVPQLQAAGLYAYIKDEDFNKTTQHMRDAVYNNGEDGYLFSEHMKSLKEGWG